MGESRLLHCADMGELLKLVAVLVVFLSVVGLAWLVAWRLGLLKGGQRGERTSGRASDREDESVTYVVREGVLSAGERAFWPVLQEAVRLVSASRVTSAAVPPVVLCNVRLADVLGVSEAGSGDRSVRQGAINRITSKQVDFVVCDGVSTRALLVVELDDRSHARGDRRERDAFVDRACASAGLPIMHVPAAASYTAKDIARQIVQALESAGGTAKGRT